MAANSGIAFFNELVDLSFDNAALLVGYES